MHIGLYKEALLNILYPRGLRCVVCNNELGPQVGVCKACTSALPFIHPPMCQCCGKPLMLGASEETNRCPDCRHESHNFDEARAVFEYSTIISQLLYRFKYGTEFHLGLPFGHFMAGAIQPSWKVDLMLPVPLHPNRKKKRGYNQSALLADAIADYTGLALQEGILLRTMDTPTQTKLHKRERLQNLQSAFFVSSKAPIRGKNILLVDDVYTTGATADSCSQPLKDAGANKIYVITLATGRNV